MTTKQLKAEVGVVTKGHSDKECYDEAFFEIGPVPNDEAKFDVIVRGHGAKRVAVRLAALWNAAR